MSALHCKCLLLTPKRTSDPWCFLPPSYSSKILSDVEDNRRWLRFRDAEGNREPHKRDTPNTAKIYRPAAYAAGSAYRARDVCIFTASGNGHLCVSRLRNCHSVSNHGWHAHHF